MFPILTFTIALAGLTLAVAALLLGWRQLQRVSRRAEELAETLNVNSVRQGKTERAVDEITQRNLESAATLSGLRAGLENLDSRFTDVEAYAAVCVPPKPVASGMNINRRVEAVRLLKEGQSEEQVSSELGIALSEVRLIAHIEKTGPRAPAKRNRRVA